MTSAIAPRRRTRWVLITLFGVIGLIASVAAGVSSQAAPSTAPTTGPVDRPQAEERLSFQSHDAYGPREHLNADVAMVYGIDRSLPERIKTWRDHGYTIHVMTGVAW